MKRWHGPIAPIDYNSEVVQLWVGWTTQAPIVVTEHWQHDIDEDYFDEGFSYDEIEEGESGGGDWITIERFPLDARGRPSSWSCCLPAPDGERLIDQIIAGMPEQVTETHLVSIVEELLMERML